MSTEQIEERTKQAEEADATRQNLGMPMQPGEEPKDKSELVEQLTDDDLVTSDDSLENVKSKAFPSGNFSEEEAQENRHWLDVILIRKKVAYPHPGQDVTGILREWVHDDPEAGLSPVSKEDRLTDETFKQASAARITKGKEGSLITLVLRQIRESVVRRGGESGGGGLLGRFR